MKQVLFFLLFAISSTLLCAQSVDTFTNKNKILNPIIDDSFQNIFIKNKFIHFSEAPVSVKVKANISQNAVFYLLVGLLMLLSFLRFFFPRYFANLFKVFFNTSLRQSQLTDQLLQAKLPALLFNLFFILSEGIYLYFILAYYQLVNLKNQWVSISLCAGLIGAIYFLKFCTLKFIGWLTGFKEEADGYIFIVFLINKIIGIFLVPFTILIAFAQEHITYAAIIASFFIIAFFLLLRFFRSYMIVKDQLKITHFHFFVYILAIELLPLLLIYKAMLVLLGENS